MTHTERLIRFHIVASCGNGGIPTDSTIQRFVDMLQSGEADVELFRRIGGDYIVKRIEERMTV